MTFSRVTHAYLAAEGLNVEGLLPPLPFDYTRRNACIPSRNAVPVQPDRVTSGTAGQVQGAAGADRSKPRS
jgi:hypothetical protein